MDFPYEGIPTIPPRKNMTHMVRKQTSWSDRFHQPMKQLTLLLHPLLVQAFFCSGCRYRVEAYPDWTAKQVNQGTKLSLV